MGHVWDDWKIVRPSSGHRGEESSLVFKVLAHVGSWELRSPKGEEAFLGLYRSLSQPGQCSVLAFS